MKCREQHYATNTLAEHRRILTEGNRFKRDATRVISLLKDFTLTVSVAATTAKEGDGGQEVPSGSTTLRKQTEREQKKKKKKNTMKETETSCSPKPRKDANDEKKSKAAAKKRMMRLKTGGKKQYTRAEVDAQLRDSLKRLVDWSQRAYKIMDNQMTDISKLYMATMTYNMHLNTPYVAKKTRV